VGSARGPFTLIVSATGIVTSVVILLTGLVSERLLGEPIGLPDPPIFAVIGVVFFVVAASVCYAGGWIAELLVRRAWPDQSDQFGGLAFTLGVVFAVAVTLAPAVLISGAAILFGLARWLGYGSTQ
jgi:hypothetical protein